MALLGYSRQTALAKTDNRDFWPSALLEEGCVIFFRAFQICHGRDLPVFFVSLICLHFAHFCWRRILDGRPVTNISSSLDEGLSGYDADGTYASNAEIVFKGVHTGGDGILSFLDERLSVSE